MKNDKAQAMKIDEIKTIVKLMTENDLTEFKIESDALTLCLKRGSQQPTRIATVVQPSVQTIAPAAPVQAPAQVASAPAAPAAPDKSKIIESPIVGTFYRCGAPGADPYVKVGSKVDADTTVCIVEAMKVMNEIKAEKSGVIKEMLVENGQSVEFGQPLFILE